LNPQRQILTANRAFLDLAVETEMANGLAPRPGEALGCVHAHQRLGGCGASEACTVCGAARALGEATRAGGPAAEECRMRVAGRPGRESLDLLVQCAFLPAGGQLYTLLAVLDIAAAKRRRVLEKTLFEEALPAARHLHELSREFKAARHGANPTADLERRLLHHSGSLLDEVTAQRLLLEAERGELNIHCHDVPVRLVLEELVGMYSTHDAAEGREIEIGPCAEGLLRTDPHLLRRVLGQLLRNALEATPDGGKVTLAAVRAEDDVEFWVHNAGEIPRQVQLQIFQRSFTTRPEPGRGTGTYAARLFAEQYLGGRVSFSSSRSEGTLFTVTLPCGGPVRRAA